MILLSIHVGRGDMRGHGDVSRVPLEVGQGKRPHVPSDVPMSRLTSPCPV